MGSEERSDGAGTEPDRLAARVVEYPDGPDRRTIYPRDVDDVDRVTHWLSADRSAFVGLELRR